MIDGKAALGVLLLLASCAAPERPSGDVRQTGEVLLSADGELLEERWHSVRLNGSKLGHVQEVRRRVGERIRTESLSQVWNQAEAPRPAFVDHFQFEETLDGRPARFKVRSRSPLGNVDVEARMLGDRIEFSDGSTQPLDSELLFPVALEARFRRGGDVSYRTIDVTGKLARISARAGVEEGGVVRYSVTSDQFPGLVATEWRDRQGRFVKSDAKIGLRIEQERCAREAALWLETRYSVFRGKLGDARKVRRALYRVTVKEGAIDPAAFAFDGQTVEKVEGRQVTLRVDPYRPDAPSTERGAPIAEDPAVAAAAKEAVGEEKNAWKAAQAIERWVHQKIRYAPAVLFSAKEVLERGEGDCGEMALLAAAMARAAGIEARVSSGLAASGPIFGEHAWTEVRVGRWAGIDATMGGPFFDATHIQTDDSVHIKNLEIEVLEADAP